MTGEEAALLQEQIAALEILLNALFGERQLDEELWSRVCAATGVTNTFDEVAGTNRPRQLAVSLLCGLLAFVLTANGAPIPIEMVKAWVAARVKWAKTD